MVCPRVQYAVPCYLYFILTIYLIFLIYKATYILFADNSTLLFSNKNYDELVRNVNCELSSIYKWLRVNRLSLNITKSQLILFTNRYETINLNNNCILDESPLQMSPFVKYLGVVFDKKLNFSLPIDSVCSKISRTIGIIYKIRPYVPDSVIFHLYYSIIYPHLTYCVLVWGNTYTTYLNQLLLIQKKYVRILTNSHYLAHTNPLFAQTKMLKVTDIYTYYVSIKAFKLYKTGNLNSTQHNFNTRNSVFYVPPLYQRLSTTQRSIKFSLPTVWNGLPAYLKESNTISAFKIALRSYLLQQY